MRSLKILRATVATAAVFGGCRARPADKTAELAPPVVAKYQAMLTNADADVRAAGAIEVARLGPPAAVFVPTLLEAMRDNRGIGFEIKCPFPEVKCAHHVVEAQNQAIHALGAIGPQASSALDALQKARQSWELEEEADEAIKKIVAGRRTRG